MSARTTAPSWPLVALFTAGYLAPYLLPTTVGRLDAALPLSATQAGAVGSLLLLSSAAAGFALASRIHRLGARRLARAGLLLAVLGYGTAALSTSVPTVIAGALVGGLGSGTATTVAAAGTAARRDPHRTTTLGLLSVSALAAAVYLTVPHLGPGHGLPLAAVALTAALVWPATAHLPTGSGEVRATAHRPAATPPPPLPYRRPGLVLAAAMLCWSLAQNSLWGVSSHIGTRQAGLGEATVGVVFAAALGAGLLGVLCAGALGPRIGRALPVGVGTVLIAVCIVVSAGADGLTSFAVGEIAWNALYPVVLSYLISLAASLDPHGRWAVLAGSASSLGTACGPLAGSLLSAAAGYPAMGWVLATALLLLAVPLAAVAVRTTGGPVLRGPEPVLRGGPVEQPVQQQAHQPVEQPVVEITVDHPQPARQEFDTAGPQNSGTSPSAPAP
ncbi:MFS transporter [Streptomyces dioscori]|uniref:MFS transporter n=1 Tax=Streptomyces dioscori TaxID=2109333 RepID=A0A2P8QAQ3_9ACTN|nr:MFS transporter [Streptomyces dioscori]PSM43325.1 MFS transporter [Streptomyces dioscori]